MRYDINIYPEHDQVAVARASYLVESMLGVAQDHIFEGVPIYVLGGAALAYWGLRENFGDIDVNLQKEHFDRFIKEGYPGAVYHAKTGLCTVQLRQKFGTVAEFEVGCLKDFEARDYAEVLSYRLDGGTIHVMDITALLRNANKRVTRNNTKLIQDIKVLKWALDKEYSLDCEAN